MALVSMRAVTGGLVMALAAGIALGQEAQTATALEQGNPQHVPLAIRGAEMQTMRVVLRGRGTYVPRDNCPVVSSLTGADFTGGTYTAQGGFAEGEIAAATYTLPAAMFPLKITLLEYILAQQNATVQTTTQYTVLVWDGRPTDVQPSGFPIAYSSSNDPGDPPPVVMGPGTRGTNIQISIDPGDPDQMYVYNTSGAPTHSFTIGLRIDHHNSQTANPCTTAPPATRNAFPCTDNTVIGCGTGYSALNYPTDNWLFAVNCGPNGCPPNGGWTRLSALQTDQIIFGICFQGCRPRGDWVMRATWDPVNCPPPNGACCFGTSGCFVTDQATCTNAGGTYKGPGSVCGTPTNGQFPGCATPANTAPVAVAGDDVTVDDADGSGAEVVAVDGSGSYDNDAGDFISAYRWTEGATTIQDGPAFCSTSLPVGVHTLTLRVTDSHGAVAFDNVQVTVLPAPACDPDYNQDGNADQDDVAYLVNVISGGENPTGRDPDFTQDGNADQDDISALINTIGGGGCP